jgi:hypothetical protein
VASYQIPRDLRGARGWVFVPEVVFFATSIACVIDMSISKVLGCHTPGRTRCSGGYSGEIEQQRARPNMLPPEPLRCGSGCAGPSSRGRLKRILRHTDLESRRAADV